VTSSARSDYIRAAVGKWEGVHMRRRTPHVGLVSCPDCSWITRRPDLGEQEVSIADTTAAAVGSARSADERIERRIWTACPVSVGLGTAFYESRIIRSWIVYTQMHDRPRSPGSRARSRVRRVSIASSARLPSPQLLLSCSGGRERWRGRSGPLSSGVRIPIGDYG
jgi:hypothetical protein